MTSRSVAEAKDAYNKLYWNEGSLLQTAQNNLQRAVTADANGRASLEQAKVAIDMALESSDLSDPMRETLMSQKAQLDTALAAYDAGQPVEYTSELSSLLTSVYSANNTPGVTVTETLLAEARKA